MLAAVEATQAMDGPHGWQSDKRFASLTVTMGRVVGPAFGGNGIVFVKPSVFGGSDRPGKWGIESGYKVIGF